QLHELDHVAADAAPEALEQALVRVDVERRRLLLMERTEPLPRRAGLPERRDLADDRHHVGLRLEVLDERLRKQTHSLSSTMVAPPPPSRSGAGETVATSGCSRKKRVSA